MAGPHDKGLPWSGEAERFVLGSILADDAQFELAVPTLQPDDFHLDKHRRIFRRMIDVRVNENQIDHVTVANELKHYGELESVGGISYLASLDDGMPQILNLASYVKIVKQKSALRKLIFASDDVIKRAMREDESAVALITRHVPRLARIAQNASGSDTVSSVDDLESIFGECAPIDYLVEPELPGGNIVYLAGDSESGKSTLACAWARDVRAKGHAVLLLDRDKNPRERIRERFQRLGVVQDDPLLKVWDGQQKMEAPQRVSLL